jgi:hypothetical protein
MYCILKIMNKSGLFFLKAYLRAEKDNGKISTLLIIE